MSETRIFTKNQKVFYVNAAGFFCPKAKIKKTKIKDFDYFDKRYPYRRDYCTYFWIKECGHSLDDDNLFLTRRAAVMVRAWCRIRFKDEYSKSWRYRAPSRKIRSYRKR